MDFEVQTCSPTDEIRLLATTMTQGRFRHLPVVDQGALVGLISIGDILRRMVDTHRHEAEQLKQYIATGGYPA